MFGIKIKKIKFIYIIGVEGCGHHGLSPIVENLIRSSLNESADFYSWEKLRKAFNWIWLNKNPVVNILGRFLVKYTLLVLKLYASRPKGSDTVYILENNSFPSGEIRTVAQGWNLFQLYELVRHHAEVCLIVLNREPIAATFSHKELDRGFREHAEVIAKHLDYLAETMQVIGVDNFRSISYEELSSCRDQAVEGIVNYLGLQNADARSAYKDYKPSRKNWRNSLEIEDAQWAESFFDEERSKNWRILTDKKHSLIRTKKKNLT